MPRCLKALSSMLLLDQLPNAVAVRPDDHTAAHLGIIHQLRAYRPRPYTSVEKSSSMGVIACTNAPCCFFPAIDLPPPNKFSQAGIKKSPSPATFLQGRKTCFRGTTLLGKYTCPLIMPITPGRRRLSPQSSQGGNRFPGIPALQPKSGLSATPHKTWPWSSLDCLHYTAFFTRLQARP